MRTKIAIIPYVTHGRTNIGHDGYLNIFRKSRSTVLKENLQKVFLSKHQDVDVIVDVNHGNLQYLKREGINLFLIPEELDKYMDYTGVCKDDCFVLKYEEYENGDVTRIVDFIEKSHLSSILKD